MITQPTGPDPPDARAVAEGRALYETYCAVCHGADLAGAANWREPDTDGGYRPPPQDGTGHTWHHSDRLLTELVKQGGQSARSRMPAFEGILSDGEIRSILAFFKSVWSEEARTFQWEVSQRDTGG